ncbi:MAG TPA: hypothetical protein VNW99_06350 [Cytophagaceae bacterium]|jgi:hypothetical protein|nr:hypothetical protein [Cytophagaceae bacterium]
MANYKRFFLAVLAASIFQLVFEWLWVELLFKQMYIAQLGCVMRTSPYLPLNFISELAFASLIAYVLIISEKEGKNEGLFIGMLIGFLIAAYLGMDHFASQNITVTLLVNECCKNILLGGISGMIIGGIYKK